MDVPALAAFLQDAPPSQAPAGETTTATQGTQPPPGQAPSGMSQILGFVPWIAVIAIFYFVMIGPERKQRKKREAMLAAVKKGDKVVTTGGMFATVAAVSEDSITLQAADDVRLRFSRSAVAQVLEPTASEGSDKS